LKPINKSKRGRKPKHDLREYLKLIIIKEALLASLREAEIRYSKIICKKKKSRLFSNSLLRKEI
jgi:hypothetical protein